MLDGLSDISRRHNGDSEIFTLFFGERSVEAAKLAANIADSWGEHVEAEMAAKAVERGGYVLRPRETGDANVPPVGSGLHIKDPAGEHENLAYHAEARGCAHCRVTGEMCPIRKDPLETWPCSRCREESVECELLVPVKIKGCCTDCRKRKLKCSYTEKGADHARPCAACTESGFKCVAGPPGGYMPERLTIDYLEAKKRGDPRVEKRERLLKMLKKRTRSDAFVDNQQEESGEGDEDKEPEPKRLKSEPDSSPTERESSEIEETIMVTETEKNQIEETIMESIEGNEEPDTALNQELPSTEVSLKQPTEDAPSTITERDATRSPAAYVPTAKLTPDSSPSPETPPKTTKETNTEKKGKKKLCISQESSTPEPTAGPPGAQDEDLEPSEPSIASSPKERQETIRASNKMGKRPLMPRDNPTPGPSGTQNEPDPPPAPKPAPPRSVQLVRTALHHPLTIHEGALPPGIHCNWCRQAAYGLVLPARKPGLLRVTVSEDGMTWIPVPTGPIAGADHPAVNEREVKKERQKEKARERMRERNKEKREKSGKKPRAKAKAKSKAKSKETVDDEDEEEPREMRQPPIRPQQEVGSHMCARHALAAGGIARCAAGPAHRLRRIVPPPLGELQALAGGGGKSSEDEEEEGEGEDGSPPPPPAVGAMALLAAGAKAMRDRLDGNRPKVTDVWCRVCVFPALYECGAEVCAGWRCDLKLCDGCERELRENGRGNWGEWIARRVAGESRAADRRDLELLAGDSLLGRFLDG